MQHNMQNFQLRQQLLLVFYSHTDSSGQAVRDLMLGGRYSLRAASNFRLNFGRIRLFDLFATQTARVLLDLITELGLFSRLKSFLHFLQVLNRKMKVGQMSWFNRQKICEFFFTNADPNHNMFVSFCALTYLMDFDDAALTEQERNQRKAILEIMRKSVLREDIFLYLQARHQSYFLATNDVFSPTDELFQRSFDWYCRNFSWFMVLNTNVRNHRPPPVLVDAEPDEVDDQPPEIV
jgi:hypothetical protein